MPKAFASQTEFHEIVNHYKSLRLQALKLNPESFSSTYGQESQFPLDTWQSRVLNPVGQTYVAVTSIDNDSPSHLSLIDCNEGERESKQDLHLLLRNEWVGIATAIGPKTWTRQDGDTNSQPWDVFIQQGNYIIPQSVLLPSETSGAHLVYLIVGMFVLPHARGKGKAQRILEAAARGIWEEAKEAGASAASIVIQVEPMAINAQRLYERVGFKVKGKVLIGSTEAIALVKDLDLGSYT
jgi:GNAT superfamily N-acetyltransferase